MEQQKQRPKQGRSLTRKIIEAHYVKGSLTPGEEVFLRVDQTLDPRYQRGDDLSGL